MRILLAEDDLRLGKLIQYMLGKEGHQVEWVTDGDMAYEYAVYDAYEVLILDWMMPGKTGVEVCKALRERQYRRAILMLTARDAVEDRVAGLDLGADDYLVKPFEFSELSARLRALARRSDTKLQRDIIELGDFVLDRSQKLLLRENVQIQLSPREFQIFDLLVQNKGFVVPREVILERVWGLESEVSSNNVDSHVKLLRRKLELDGEINLIHTVRGIGYKLEE